MLANQEDVTPSGATAAPRTPPRAPSVRSAKHTPTPSPRASRTRPHKEAAPTLVEIRDAEGRLVKTGGLNYAAIEKARVASESKDSDGFEKAARKVCGPEMPAHILDDATTLFMLSEPVRLADFEDDQLVRPGRHNRPPNDHRRHASFTSIPSSLSRVRRGQSWSSCTSGATRPGVPNSRTRSRLSS